MGIELQVLDDAVAWAKRSKHVLFPNGRVDALTLLAYVMADVIVIGRGECRIAQRGAWSVISSDVDWLAHPRLSIEQLFTRLVPSPEHGDNTHRAEVVVNAFASDVAIWDRDGLRVIKGKRPRLDVTAKWRECRRALAFRFDHIV